MGGPGTDVARPLAKREVVGERGTRQIGKITDDTTAFASINE